VEPVLSYGCQVWAPSLCCDRLDFSKALDRQFNPAEGVHLDFLRYLGGLPNSSPQRVVMAEFGRNPVQVHWLVLMARFWSKAVMLDEGHIVRECMLSSVQLYKQGDRSCWAAQFFNCMQHIGAIQQSHLQACRTADAILRCEDLRPSDKEVMAAAVSYFGVFWRSVDSGVQPDSASSDMVFASTYKHWVVGDASGDPGDCRWAGAPHLKMCMTHKLRQPLVRLRVSGFPLRVMTGRLEKREELVNGKKKKVSLPRHLRHCMVCGQSCVEDLQHFLLQCPCYQGFRDTRAELFHQQATTVSVLSHPDQYMVASTMRDMLQLRSSLLGPIPG
jgi:hypothetical protein